MIPVTPPNKLRIFYAGCSTIKDCPEALYPDMQLNILLNFWDIDRDVSKIRERMQLHHQNRQKAKTTKHANRRA